MPSSVFNTFISFAFVVLVALVGCKSSGAPPVGPEGRNAEAKTTPAASCKAELRTQAPGVPDAMKRGAYWLAKVADADAVLMADDAIGALNTSNAKRAMGFQDVTKASIGDQKRVDREIQERHAWLLARLKKGKYVEGNDGAFARTKALIDGAGRIDELRVLVAAADLRCIPMTDALYQPPVDPAFDRNQCSGLHAGELVRLLRKSADGRWVYAHAGHSVGWLEAPQTTPSLPVDKARGFRDATPRLVVTATSASLPNGLGLRMGATLPIEQREGDEVVVTLPTLQGLVGTRMQPPKGTSVGFLPFTRRNVYERALAYLDHPYGWGERDGGQDCSRLMLDVFSTVGVRLGRHSGEQAKAGSRVIGLDGKDVAERRRILSDAMKQGVVFAYMPGHIMLMLGEEKGRAYAVSAIAEFMEPCGEGDKTIRLDRVVVSDMSLGEGTTKTSFIERITKLAVFGKLP